MPLASETNVGYCKSHVTASCRDLMASVSHRGLHSHWRSNLKHHRTKKKWTITWKTLLNCCQLHFLILIVRYDFSVICCTLQGMPQPNCGNPALYAGNPFFKSQPKGQLSWMSLSHFPQLFQVNAVRISPISTQLLPYTFFPTHFSLLSPSFDISESELLTALLNQLHINILPLSKWSTAQV